MLNMQEPDKIHPAESPLRNIYDVKTSDPKSELVDRSGMSEEDIAQIGRLMKSLASLRDVERSIGEASARYMELSAPDMRALHYLIVAGNAGEVVTRAKGSEIIVAKSAMLRGEKSSDVC